MNEAQKSIIYKAMQIRKNRGENIVDVLKTYKNLTDAEKEEILSEFELEYTLSLDEVKNDKINELSAVCKKNIEAGVTIKIDDVDETFSYGIESGDQGNIDDIFSLAVSTGLSQPYHSNGGSCKLYTVAQITELYVACKMLKTKETTYFNQMKQYVNTLEDAETIKAITYGDELTGIYLENYNAMMAQSQEIIQALAATGLVDTDDTSSTDATTDAITLETTEEGTVNE